MEIKYTHGLDAWAWRMVKRLLASRKGDTSFNALDAQVWLREEFEILVGWEPLDSILEELEGEGRAYCTWCNADGFKSYIIP